MNGSGTSRVDGKCGINVLVFLVAVEFGHIEGHRHKGVEGLSGGVVGQFGCEIGAGNGHFERRILDAEAREPCFELVRVIAVEAGTGLPIDVGVCALQFCLGCTDTGGSGGAEGDDGLSAEVVGVQEGEDDAGNFGVPDGEAQEHDVIVCAGKGGVDGRTGRSGAVLLLIGAGGGVVIVAVIAGVGFSRGDLVGIGPEDIGYRIGNSFCSVGEGEVGYEDSLGAVDGIGPVIKLDGETGVSFCGNGEVEVHRGGVPGECGGDGSAASGEVFIGRDFDGSGIGRNICVGDAQDGGLMRQVCLEVVAAVFDQGTCPAVAKVPSLGGSVFRGIGKAESMGAFVVVIGNIRIGNLGTVFDGEKGIDCFFHKAAVL